MQHAATINFIDADSNDEASIFVRYNETTVGLAVSLLDNGDIEVFMPKTEARKLIDALQQAVR